MEKRITLFFLISFFLLSLTSLVFVDRIKADVACGSGAYCTGSNTYLKVDSCVVSSNGADCLNSGVHSQNMTCPTGGGSGSCVGPAPGRLGCPHPPVSSGTSCFCTAGGGSCSTSGSSCTDSQAPYSVGTCSCSGGGATCAPPDQNTTLGCCLAGTRCGDGVCEGGEYCGNCQVDCGVCTGGPTATPTALCGNGVVNAGETCSNCPADVGACPPICGDGEVDPGETCSSCPADAGACGAVCGNHIIESGETCTNCPADVGQCSGGGGTGGGGGSLCGNGVINAGETCSNCPADVGACQPPPPPECTCSAPYCGQLDSCGSALCSNIDDRPALAPTLASPADDAVVTAVDSTSGGVATKAITLTITTQSDVNYNAYYTYLDIYPVGTSCANALAKCNQLVASGAAKGSTVTYTYHIPATQYGTHSNFQWRVWHQNNTCTLRNGTASAWSTFSIGDTISGTVLRDDGIAGLSGGVCISPFSPVTYIPPNGVITVSYGGNTYTANVNPDGTWQITVPISSTGQYSVSLATSNAVDACGCPAGCQYSGINSPSSNIAFYYQPQDVRDPWWQTIGGSIFAGGTTGSAVQSNVPTDTCIGGECEPYLSLRNDADETESSGVAFTGGGNIDTTNESGYQTGNIDEDGRNIQAVDAATDTLVENYEYFYRLYSMGVNPSSDLSAVQTKPTTAPANGRAYFRGGDMTINNQWSLTSTESMVVFVNGNLNINNRIIVPEGGFLAFIVSGNITIGTSVCQTNGSTTGIVQGVFIADGTFNVSSTGTGDCKFVGEGIFTAWNGFYLGRDYKDGADGDFLNAKEPTEVFRYRPDFVVNIPARMTRPLYQWLEVAP